MITPPFVRTMAAYNAEMNRRLYESANRLSDDERRRDCGAFWHSIHGTLVHILWGDAQWMSRFERLATEIEARIAARDRQIEAPPNRPLHQRP